MRLSHELKSHEASSFVTLTYATDPGSVNKPDCQNFMKRLRFNLQHKKIRFYMVSEYGEKTGRAHYHAVIFGHDFSCDPGSYLVRRGLYASPLLDKSWGLGHASSGTVTEASIRYVTNYIIGKSNAPQEKAPTFALMSRRPGLGRAWIDEHAAETYRRDLVRVGQFERRPPRYYDTVTFGADKYSSAALRARRRESGIKQMLTAPEDHLISLSPQKKLADSKIWLARKKMSQGEI